MGYNTLEAAFQGPVLYGGHMKISARNQFRGIIREITEGDINSEVSIEIAPGIVVHSQISTASVHRLELAVGREAWAIIKIDSVMVGVDD